MRRLPRTLHGVQVINQIQRRVQCQPSRSLRCFLLLQSGGSRPYQDSVLAVRIMMLATKQRRPLLRLNLPPLPPLLPPPPRRLPETGTALPITTLNASIRNFRQPQKALRLLPLSTLPSLPLLLCSFVLSCLSPFLYGERCWRRLEPCRGDARALGQNLAGHALPTHINTHHTHAPFPPRPDHIFIDIAWISYRVGVTSCGCMSYDVGDISCGWVSRGKERPTQSQLEAIAKERYGGGRRDHTNTHTHNSHVPW